MAGIKLGKLPDRTLVKLNVTLSPDLAKTLEDYRAIYNERFDADEPLSELVPHMLAAFLASDREFQRVRHVRGKA